MAITEDRLVLQMLRGQYILWVDKLNNNFLDNDKYFAQRYNRDRKFIDDIIMETEIEKKT